MFYVYEVCSMLIFKDYCLNCDTKLNCKSWIFMQNSSFWEHLLVALFEKHSQYKQSIYVDTEDLASVYTSTVELEPQLWGNLAKATLRSHTDCSISTDLSWRFWKVMSDLPKNSQRHLLIREPTVRDKSLKRDPNRPDKCHRQRSKYHRHCGPPCAVNPRNFLFC